MPKALDKRNDLNKLEWFESLPEMTTPFVLEKQVEDRRVEFEKAKEKFDQERTKPTEPPTMRTAVKESSQYDKLLQEIQSLREQNDQLLQMMQNLQEENKKLLKRNEELVNKLLAS